MKNEIQLSDRQFEVVEHLVFRGTKKETAPSLHISERTLETYTKVIYKLLDITHLSELILWYVGHTFSIAEQIAEKKREVLSTITVLCFALNLMFFGDDDYIRRRNYRRRADYEQEIFIAPISGD